jgi:hypothetical protein
MPLNLESLQMQGAFLASVVANAQRDRQVEVVTAPRGFRKSTCVSAMASKNRDLRTHFGTASLAVKVVGGVLPETTSGFDLIDALVEDLSEVELEDVNEVARKAHQLRTLAQFFTNPFIFLPLVGSTLTKVVMAVKEPTLLLCDDVLSGLQTRAEVDQFFQRAKERLDKDPKLAIILFSSNEGIDKLLLDPTTHNRVLHLHALPAGRARALPGRDAAAGANQVQR